MVLWTRSAVRSVLASARVLRLPKKAAPAAKGKEKVSDGPLLETAKPGDAIPINYLKNGQDPVMKEDGEYPEWLFKLLEPKPSRRDLELKLEKEGKSALSIEELKRLVKLTNRERIKEHNSVARKD